MKYDYKKAYWESESYPIFENSIFLVMIISMITIFIYGETLEKNNLLSIIRWVGVIAGGAFLVMLVIRGISTIHIRSEDEEKLKLLNKQKLQANLYFKKENIR